jgi:hypothetical protein
VIIVALVDAAETPGLAWHTSGDHVDGMCPPGEIRLPNVTLDEGPRISYGLRVRLIWLKSASYVGAQSRARATIELDGKQVTESRTMHGHGEAARAREELDAGPRVSGVRCRSTTGGGHAHHAVNLP